MKPECYFRGSCIKCGCTTIALQMANKTCDAPCYPSMMNKKEWQYFLQGYNYKDSKGIWGYRDKTAIEHVIEDTPKVEYLVLYHNGDKIDLRITDKSMTDQNLKKYVETNND